MLAAWALAVDNARVMADHLAAVRLQLQRLRDRQKKYAKRSDECTGLSLHCLHVAVCIGLMADCDMRAGAAWLESKQRRGRPLQGCTSGDDLLERLRDVFREADLDWLDSLRDEHRTSLAAAAFSDAARVAEEYKLGLWVRRQNLAGVAVRTPRLIEEYRKLVHEQPPAVPLRSVPQLENSTGRNWARRWRRCEGRSLREAPHRGGRRLGGEAGQGWGDPRQTPLATHGLSQYGPVTRLKSTDFECHVIQILRQGGG